MCGILVVHNKKRRIHDKYSDLLTHRGPDEIVVTEYEHLNLLTYQSIQYFTTSKDDWSDPAILYNGEIYNYDELGYSTDLEFIYDVVNQKRSIKDGWGMYAVISVSDEIRAWLDPQGEKKLWCLNNSEWFIVASEISAIVNIASPEIDFDRLNSTLHSKHAVCERKSIYRNVTLLPRGSLTKFSLSGELLGSYEYESIFDWITGENFSGDLCEEFLERWDYVLKCMRPDEPFALAYSGGCDSSLLAADLDPDQLITVYTPDKDQHLDVSQSPLTVSPERWAEQAVEVMQYSKLPLCSHSWPNHNLIAQTSAHRIVFGGSGADELFGGYHDYRHLRGDTVCRSERSYHASPSTYYSQLWDRCYRAYSDKRCSAALMDFVWDLYGVDMVGSDVIYSQWSIEKRQPFLQRPIVQWAVNLPWTSRVSTNLKLILHYAHEKRVGCSPRTKQGFAGHCQDSLPWWEIDPPQSSTRQQEWSECVVSLFERYVA